MKFIKKYFLEIVLITFGLATTALFICSGWLHLPIEIDEAKRHINFDALRTLVLIIGALGGFYGLILASRRQKSLERQVAFGQDQTQQGQDQTQQGQDQTQQGQDQLFNESLGRGVELLSNKVQTMRLAGIRVLNNLIETSNKDQREIIIDIFSDFLKTNASFDQDAIADPPPRWKRLDIELVTRCLLDYTGIFNKKYNRDDGSPLSSIKGQKIDFSNLDLRKLDFSETAFSNACFSNTLLDDCSFYGSRIVSSKFSNDDFAIEQRSNEFNNINFQGIHIIDSCFSDKKFRNCDFSRIQIGDGKIHRAVMKRSTFSGVYFFNCDLSYATFEGENNNNNNFMPDVFFKEGTNCSRITIKNMLIHGFDHQDANFFGATFDTVECDFDRSFRSIERVKIINPVNSS